MSNIYDDKQFFDQYAKMSRSQQGLSGAGEWHQFKVMFPDLSEKMIHEANEKNKDPKIIYRVCGLEDFDYPIDSYDCVISNLVLHYIEDINAIFKKIYGTLKRNGIFLLNMEHPVFTSGVKQDWIYNSSGRPQYWPVDDYFYPGERETNFLGQNITKQHHTLTQILMGLLNAGFHLEVVEEAMPSVDMMDIPGMADEMRRPMMLLIKAMKQS